MLLENFTGSWSNFTSRIALLHCFLELATLAGSTFKLSGIASQWSWRTPWGSLLGANSRYACSVFKLWRDNMYLHQERAGEEESVMTTLISRELYADRGSVHLALLVWKIAMSHDIWYTNDWYSPTSSNMTCLSKWSIRLLNTFHSNTRRTVRDQSISFIKYLPFNVLNAWCSSSIVSL